MKPRILLIDLSALFHPAWRANENGPVSVAFEGTIGGVRRCIANAGEGALVAVCCDGKGNWRKKLATDYKAQRDPLPPVFYAELDRVKQRLRDDGLLLWQVDETADHEGFEADDLIATAVQVADREHSIRIATHDKDLLQLVGDPVDYLSLSTFEVRDEAAVRAKYGIDPPQLGDWLALVGDSSDNVKGAPGVGPKTATKLLQMFGSLRGIFDAAHDPKSDITPAVRKSLIENDSQIERARKLVTLRTDAPIKFEELYEKREQKPLTEVDMPHDLGAIQEAIEDKAQEVNRAIVEHGDEAMAGKELVPTKEVAAEIVLAFEKQLEPRSFLDAYTCAKILFNARLYQKYGNQEAMVAAIMRGREMGYGAGASLDGFHIISQTGQLAMHAHMIVDRAMQHPDFEYLDCLETDDVHCTYEGKKKSSGRSFSLTYTIDQARAAGLVRPKTNWETRPTEQLRKTCAVQVCRVLWPGAALGLYAMSELGVDEE